MLKRDITNPLYLQFLGGLFEGEGFNSVSVVEKSGSPDIYVYNLKGYKQIIKYVISF
jgi:hypothetical protein